MPVTNEGLGWEFPHLKMVHNPGGDWHPGGSSKLYLLYSELSLMNFNALTQIPQVLLHDFFLWKKQPTCNRFW